MPSGRSIQRFLSQIGPFGRPRSSARDPRFWAGMGIGLGLGGAVTALVNPRTGPATRARLRETLDGLRARMRSAPGAQTIEESIVIEVPVDTAYARWTRYEDFPKFMQGVSDVRAIGDTRYHWKAEIAGQAREWDAEITEEIPGRRVAWKSLDGPANAGVVTFHHLDPDTCKLMLQVDHVPSDVAERIGEATGVVRRRIRGDLERFRDLLEQAA